MRLTSQQKFKLRPLARWLMDTIDRQGLTLTSLARQAGLSSGALRHLVVDPDRVPEVETCLRLAQATNTPASELFHLAGLPYASEQVTELDPDRAALLNIYDAISAPALRRVLIDVARSIKNAAGGMPPPA